MRVGVLTGLLLAAAGIGALAGFYAPLHRERDANTREALSAGARQAAGSCAVAPASGDAAYVGMAWVPPGTFAMGSDYTFPEEGPAHTVSLDGFWMDQTEVTNAQFEAFVAATGYRTHAERAGAAAIFSPPQTADALRSPASWWRAVRGADWRHPEGPGSDIAARQHFPVVQIAYEDALAYAQWKGRALPSEAQFEWAAQSSARKDAQGRFVANTWQGSFPQRDMALDGHPGPAPVACFAANDHGLHDLVGNVWEWTHSAYHPRHDRVDPAHPQGHDPLQPAEREVAVVKGGSWLCSADYCMRYRPAARIGHSRTLPTGHIGFRTVLVP